MHDSGLSPWPPAVRLHHLMLCHCSKNLKTKRSWDGHTGQGLNFWKYFILMGSSESQHLPTANALVNVSGHWLPKALELYIYIFISNFLFLPFIQRKKAVDPWVLSKVTILAVFHFVYFFLNSQLPELARWQKLSELQIIEQTAYFKSGHLFECLLPLSLGKQVTFNLFPLKEI